jgi:AraC-like DNA-binding protein
MAATQLAAPAPPAGQPVDEQASGLPAAGLRSLIASYSGYRQAGLAPGRHRGLPSPYLTVIFTLDEPLTIAGHPDPAQPPGRYDTLAGGLHTTPALITHDGWQSGIQLAVSPLGARALFGLPAGELAGLDVHGAEAFGPLAGQIQRRLQAAASWPDRFAVLDELLLARVSPGSPAISPEVTRAWRQLLAAGGQAGISALAAETGWSERHLRSQFRAEIGLTPKAAARVIRFDRTRRLLQRQARSGARPVLADLAAGCGYYDQAHLDREFRALAGCPPTAWLAEEFRNVQASPAGPGPGCDS